MHDQNNPKRKLRVTDRGRLVVTMLFVGMSVSGSTYLWTYFTN